MTAGMRRIVKSQGLPVAPRLFERERPLFVMSTRRLPAGNRINAATAAIFLSTSRAICMHI